MPLKVMFLVSGILLSLATAATCSCSSHWLSSASKVACASVTVRSLASGCMFCHSFFWDFTFSWSKRWSDSCAHRVQCTSMLCLKWWCNLCSELSISFSSYPYHWRRLFSVSSNWFMYMWEEEVKEEVEVEVERLRPERMIWYVCMWARALCMLYPCDKEESSVSPRVGSTWEWWCLWGPWEGKWVNMCYRGMAWY